LDYSNFKYKKTAISTIAVLSTLYFNNDPAPNAADQGTYTFRGGMLHWLEQEFFKSQAAHFPFLDLLINFTNAQAAYPKIATPIIILAIIRSTP